MLYRSGAVFYPFRQDSNFLYLTGFLEPEALAIIRNGPSPHPSSIPPEQYDDYSFHLYVRPKDARAELWSGPRSGVDAARDVFNADEAGSVYDEAGIERCLGQLLADAKRIYTDIPLTTTTSTTHWWSAPTPGSKDTPTRLGALLRQSVPVRSGGCSRPSVHALAPQLNRLRSVKSPAEVAALRLAGKLSGRALTSAMRRQWDTEAQLHAYLDHAFSSAPGLGGPAYVPVVAGGCNALCIHYVANSAALRDGDLITVDAGGERGFVGGAGGYVADITRTWPVNGRFSPAQRDLYDAVLSVQRRAIRLVRPTRSGRSLDDVHAATERMLVEELVQIGFDRTRLEGRGGDSSGRSGLSTLFPHHVGHHIGLDVHDCPGLSRALPLRPGNAVTVEPGVYVPVDDERWPRHFRGMGVRVEDCVVVLEDESDDGAGPLVLSTEAVKEIADIEALRDV